MELRETRGQILDCASVALRRRDWRQMGHFSGHPYYQPAKGASASGPARVNNGVYCSTILRLPSRPIAPLNTWAAPEAHDLRPPRATAHPRFLSHRHSCVRNARAACSVFTLWQDFTAGSRAVERPRKSPCQSGRGGTADRRIAHARANQAGTVPASDSGVRGSDRTRAATQSAQLPHHRGGFPWLRLAQGQVPAKPGSP